jgi:hypothetical protein
VGSVHPVCKARKPLKKFKRHLTHRWCSLGPALQVIIENWKYLIFNCKHCENTTKVTERMCKILEIKVVYVEAVYVQELCDIIEPAINFLERNDNVLFDCSNVFDELMRKLLLKICKSYFQSSLSTFRLFCCLLSHNICYLPNWLAWKVCCHFIP